MTGLVVQIGVIIFAARLMGELAKKLRVPAVLGELLAGVIIGPYALGSVGLPGFAGGIFPVQTGTGIAVTPELYGFATAASIILLFSSGLETDIALFVRYSVAGGIIGIGGLVLSFALGAFTGILLLGGGFGDPRILFLGILSTATSVGITARILSDQKKMDSPEGVTILAAAVFDDVLGIIALAVVMGIVSVITSGAGTVNTLGILAIAGKAFGIWLGFTVLGFVAAKKLALFLKMFRHTYEFSVLSLGIAFLLAGFFEKQGLAMIIGAYIVGMSLSKTDIAPVIQERIRGLYDFFVPIFFVVMGMMVDVHEIANARVLMFGAIYTVLAVLAKVAGCGLPALFLGFNLRGAVRIGTGMVPRGEVALIIAGIGMSMGILSPELFGVVILMTFVTTLASPPLLSLALNIPGAGTRKQVKNEDSAQAVWKFHSDEIADIVVDTLLGSLRSEGFFIQMLDVDEGLTHARRDEVSLAIIEDETMVTIKTAKADMPFVRRAMYEIIVELHGAIGKLRESANLTELKAEAIEPADAPAPAERSRKKSLLSVIEPEDIVLDLKGSTKEEIITELVDVLSRSGKLKDRDIVLSDVLEREKSMSTGLARGLAVPHAKTDGCARIAVAVGIKKSGVNFNSMDGEPSRIFVLEAAPRKAESPYLQLLSVIGTVLGDPATFNALLNAATEKDVRAVLLG